MGLFHTGKEQQDRAYNEMMIPVRKRLSDADIFRLASNAGGCVSGTGDQILLETFGRQVAVHVPDGEITPALESWHALVLLHYILNADAVPPTGRWRSFEDMKDGLIRGTKFSGSSARWFERFLKGRQLGQVEAACLALGGERARGRGDINVRIPFFPHFPVLVSLWEADEDFDAAGKILLDGNADHYLTIEDAVTAGEIIQKRIEMQLVK